MAGAAAAVAATSAIGSAVTTAVFTAIGTGTFASLVVANVIGAIVSIGVSLAVSTVLGAVAGALTSKPKPPGFSAVAQIARERTLTLQQPISSSRIAIGEMRLGGVLTFAESTNDNDNLHQVLTMSGNELSEFMEFQVNGEAVTVTDNMVSSGDFADQIKIFTGVGSTAGDSDLNTELIANTTEWTANHKQGGCGKMYIEYIYNEDVFIGSSPSVTARLRGKKLYDTRDAGTRYSNNPALAIYDYLTNSTYGLGESSARINTTTFDAAANACEEMIAVDVTRTFTVDTATDKLTLSSVASGFKTGDICQVSTTTTLPSPFLVLTDYYAIKVDSDEIQLALTYDDALAGTQIDITTTGSGTHTLTRQYKDTFTATTADILTLPAQMLGLATGNGVEVSNVGGGLPGGLSGSTTYYWIRLTDLTGKLATTYANSLAGTAIDITTEGTGTHSLHRTEEPRYTCNGTFDTSQKPKEILEQMLTGCHGMLVYQTGKWNLYIDYQTPINTITENDLDGNIQVSSLITKRELFNGVKGVLASQDHNFLPTDFPVITNSTYLAEDENERIWKDIDLPFTTSAGMAQRIGKIQLEQARQQLSVVLPCKLSALLHQCGDTVSVDNARFGWSGKTFRVEEWKFATRGGEVPALGVDMYLRETASTVYDWDSGEETRVDLTQNTNLPTFRTVEPPSGLLAVEALYNTTDGSGVKAKATLTWTASPQAFTTGYLVEYKLTTDSEYTELPKTAALTIDILDISPGIYDFRVKAFNFFGVKSEPAPLTQEITGLGAVPTEPQNLSVSAIGGLALLRWDLSPDLDVKIGGRIEIRHDQLTTGADLTTSVTVGEALGGSETVAVLPLKVGTYFVRMVDSSGLKSSAASVSTKQASVSTFSGLSSISEHSTFGGTHSDTYVDGSANLTLTGSTDIDDWADVDLVADFDFEGGTASEGTYTFLNSFDFATVSKKRLTSAITVLIVNSLDMVDSRLDDIDDWADVDGTAGSDADARVYVRHTDDDPTGSPTWTSWQLLESAEFEARAFQFKCVLSTTDSAYTIKVSELTIHSEEI